MIENMNTDDIKKEIGGFYFYQFVREWDAANKHKEEIMDLGYDEIFPLVIKSYKEEWEPLMTESSAGAVSGEAFYIFSEELNDFFPTGKTDVSMVFLLLSEHYISFYLSEFNDSNEGLIECIQKYFHHHKNEILKEIR